MPWAPVRRPARRIWRCASTCRIPLVPGHTQVLLGFLSHEASAGTVTGVTLLEGRSTAAADPPAISLIAQGFVPMGSVGGSIRDGSAENLQNQRSETMMVSPGRSGKGRGTFAR